MSTLRFRAWHLPSKTMETPSGENFLMVSSNGKIVLFEGEAIKESNDYVVMQSTGLKDKNGVEIWEGDIVKRYDDIGWIEYGTKIDTNEGFSIDIAGFGFVQHEGREPTPIYQNCEVIGNRYESPSLLPL